MRPMWRTLCESPRDARTYRLALENLEGRHCVAEIAEKKIVVLDGHQFRSICHGPE